MYTQRRVSDLFTVGIGPTGIGNYKYGNLERSTELGLFPDVADSRLDVRVENRPDPSYKPTPETMAFYSIIGHPGGNVINQSRALPGRRTAFAEIHDLLSSQPRLVYNDLFRNWTLSRFSKMLSPGELLSDITTLGLLNRGVLSFHGGAVAMGDRGFLLAGLPDTGKTLTTMTLVGDPRFDFMSEDICLITSDAHAHAVPITQTVEKRRGMTWIERRRCALYNAFVRSNCIKRDVFQVMPGLEQRVRPAARIETLFFLSRGPLSLIELEAKAKARQVTALVHLNNLEFAYSRNDLILSYLFFNTDHSINHFLTLEKEMIGSLLDKLRVVRVTAPEPTAFAPVIRDFIMQGN